MDNGDTGRLCNEIRDLRTQCEEHEEIMQTLWHELTNRRNSHEIRAERCSAILGMYFDQLERRAEGEADDDDDYDPFVESHARREQELCDAEDNGNWLTSRLRASIDHESRAADAAQE